MKNITLPQAFAILQDAAAVIIDDTVIYPSLADLEGSDENEFLYLEWEIEGLVYCAKFAEGDNQSPQVSGSSLFLFDTDGDDGATQITILHPVDLEK